MSVTLVDGWELMVGGLRRLRHARAWMVAVCLLVGTVPVKAQVATDLNEGLQVTKSATTGVFTLSWWGQAGRTYFIQQSFDLMTWHYVPVVLSGSAAVTGMNFSCAETRQFWKLRYTDAATGGNAQTADFDGDGLTNLEEATLGTDPFSADMDGDAVLDGDEVALGSDPKANDWTPRPVEFIYDDTNRVTGHQAPGQTAAVFAPDSEGNVKTQP
jgi:hypothetical protein